MMNSKHFYIRSAIFLLFLFAANPVFAQPKIFQANKPSWVDPVSDVNLKQNPRDVSEGYYLKLYDYQIHAEEQTYFVHFIREIISETGIQNGSEIWVTFAPDYQKLTFHQVAIKRNGEYTQRLNIHDFKIIASEQEASSFIYNSNYSAYLILDDIRVGDQIEYSYSLKGDNPVFKGRFFEDIYLQTSVPISHLYTSVLVSEKRDLTIKEYNGAKKAVHKQDKGLLKLVWQEQMLKAPKYESNTPSWYNNYQHVQISEYKDWNDVSDWAKSINPIPETLTGELLKTTQDLLDESKGDQKVFADKAIRLVQDDIRYTGIEIGEYSHRANKPEKVFSQRYGDCKDKSMLLVSMMRQAGIKAYIALVDTRLAHKIPDEVPSPSAFNHAIVYLKINEKPYWLDPTISKQGGSLDNRSFPYNGTALLLSDDEDRMRRMEFNEEGNVSCSETYSLSLTDSTKAELSVETIYKGWQADILRSQLAYNSILETEKSYLSYYSRLYPLIELADSLIISDNKQKNEIKVEEKYSIPEFLIQDPETKQYVVSFYANMINDQLPTLSGKRESPVSISYPTNIDYTIKVISPLGWSIKKEHYFLDRNGYLFGMNAKNNADTLILNYQFKYHTPEISAEESSEFALDIKNITNTKLGYTFVLPDLTLNSNDTYSWNAILYSILLMIAFAFIGYKIYQIKKPSPMSEAPTTYNTIGGWLIVLLIGFIFSPIRIALSLFILKFHKIATWNSPLFPDNLESLKALLSFELTMNIFLLCFSILCIALFVNRKASFPFLAVTFLCASLLIQIIDVAFYSFINSQNKLTITDFNEVIRSTIITAIWVPYLLLSTRVKGTFINV